MLEEPETKQKLLADSSQVKLKALLNFQKDVTQIAATLLLIFEHPGRVSCVSERLQGRLHRRQNRERHFVRPRQDKRTKQLS